MDRVLRLIALGAWALFVSVLALAPLRYALAYGTVPVNSTQGYRNASCTTGTDGTDAVALAKCGIALKNSQPQSNFGNCRVQSENASILTMECLFIPNGNWLSSGGALQKITLTGCPEGATLTSGQCVCNPGLKAVAGQCLPYSCTDVLSGISGGGLSWSGSGGSSCFQGCQVNATAWGYSPSNNTSYTTSDLLTVGGYCQGSDNSGTSGSTAPAPQHCPVGQCPGTVNGQSVCVACNANAPGPSSGASAPSGSTAPGLPGFPNAPAGATGATSGTTCSGGNCTTTTTFTNGSGGVVGTTSETEPQSSFCDDNPTSPLCRDTAFNGACSATTCEGDAVQCAIAREAYKRNCEFFAPVGSAVDAASAAARDGVRPSWHPATSPTAEAMDFGTRIDQTNRLSSGCPADVSVQAMGQTLNVEFSKLCSPLQMLGNLVVGVSMLAAAFIVFKG